MEKIKVKLHEGGHMPERHGAFYDLATKQEERLSKGEVRILPLGVSMVLPNGGWGLLVPRSSTCLKHGIIEANSVGVVEPDYCGDSDEWGFVAYAIRDTVIPEGTRICQFAVCNTMDDFELEQVDTTGKPNRGGYGSTGEMAKPKCLDADGVEIRVGDTLYALDFNGNPKGDRLIVKGLLGHTNEYVLSYECETNGATYYTMLPKFYTHREPDSWEKLRADVSGGNACTYFGMECCHCDGCRAEECGDCGDTMASDVVDRAKRLAGVADE